MDATWATTILHCIETKVPFPRIGMALTDSLDELITSGAITPQLAMKVLQQVSSFPSSVFPVNIIATPFWHSKFVREFFFPLSFSKRKGSIKKSTSYKSTAAV